MYDIEKIRADFPILSRQVNGRPLVYLDNGASAQKPRAVIDAVTRGYAEEYSNVHRGLHYLSNLATEKYEAVRGTPQPTGAITPPGFFGTDAGHLYALGGMEGVVCGPGGKYNTMPDERVEIADYLDMIRIYVITMCDICELQ